MKEKEVEKDPNKRQEQHSLKHSTSEKKEGEKTRRGEDGIYRKRSISIQMTVIIYIFTFVNLHI